MRILKRYLVTTFTAVVLLGFPVTESTLNAKDDAKYKPFIHAYDSDQPLEAVVTEVKAKLTAAGFEVAGEHRPYDGSVMMGFTNDTLKAAAAKSESGGYAVAQRVSMVTMKDKVQVAYTNPTYMAYAYQMDDNLAAVTDALVTVLGAEGGEYGVKKAKTAKQLRKYHYMFGMPYYDDPMKLASHADYQTAIAKVEENLAAGAGGTSKVYRIDIPGKDQALFAVGMTTECSSDKFVMDEIDFKDVRSAAHLPYELMVDGGDVYALHAKFRIAMNFPDLSMMGSNSFMGIMCSPDDIRDALRETAGYTKKKRKKKKKRRG